jgi:hypothetical protein
MAPQPTTESDSPGPDTALPPDIIAQAEAAVAGNAPTRDRRPSRQQHDLHKTLSGEHHSLKLEANKHC